MRILSWNRRRLASSLTQAETFGLLRAAQLATPYEWKKILSFFFSYSQEIIEVIRNLKCVNILSDFITYYVQYDTWDYF